jgi:hypothetical protein
VPPSDVQFLDGARYRCKTCKSVALAVMGGGIAPARTAGKQRLDFRKS